MSIATFLAYCVTASLVLASCFAGWETMQVLFNKKTGESYTGAGIAIVLLLAACFFAWLAGL